MIDRPDFTIVLRRAVEEEWIQCMFSGDVWKAIQVNEEGDVVVGKRTNVFTKEEEPIFLEDGCYYVFEQGRRDEPEIEIIDDGLPF